MVNNIKFRHLGIVVENVERSLFFYNLLNFKICKTAEEDVDFISKMYGSLDRIILKTIRMVDINDNMIELLDHGESKILSKRVLPGVGISHFALTVDNLEEIYTKLSDAGFEFLSSPQVSVDNYAKVVFCKGPDGVFIELVEVL